jgi:hypothetical protein
MSLRERAAKLLLPPEMPIERAIELKRGGVYVIESAEPIQDLEGIQAYLDAFKKRTGCEFLILDAGLRIATAPQDEAEV